MTTYSSGRRQGRTYQARMHQYLNPDVAAVQRIALIPSILETVSQITGLRFTCIARVTPQAWTACAVFDQMALGLKPGTMLDAGMTLCDQVMATGTAVTIDAASTDPRYKDHPAPSLYGFESFISVPIRRQDGAYFGTLCGIDPLQKTLTGTAALASMTLFAELISQQLSAQQVLEDTQVALLDANESAELREQFIAVLGHDLRNPLGTIITGAELMLQSLDNPERMALLAKLIQGSGKRMAALVDDVVDFTRGKMGGGIALKMSVDGDLHQVVAQVVDELRSTYPQRDIRLESIAHGAMLCDAGRIGQLCSNLLKNALVYGDVARPVGVKVQIAGGRLELAVTNHGPPMSAETLAHLFKPYWRAATKSAYEGLGLGLFIVGEIARTHGGAMTVTSTADLTTFLFTLDARPDAAAHAAQDAPAAAVC